MAGIATDKWGAKWICFGGVALSIPAYACLIIKGPLPLFIFFLALLGVSLSAFLAPVMHDLSVLVAETPGMSSAHSFSLFNLSFSVGAFIGPSKFTCCFASYTLTLIDLLLRSHQWTGPGWCRHHSWMVDYVRDGRRDECGPAAGGGSVAWGPDQEAEGGGRWGDCTSQSREHIKAC